MDESSLLLRQIPHSVEAEQSVLGAMLIDPRCIPNVVEQLTGEDFYLKPNRDIYETIYTMFSFSATIDPVTVLDQMKLRGVYDENTTSNYLLQLMEITPTAANVSEYIRIVKDKALLRRISETAGELTTLVQEGGETAQAVLDLAEQRIYAIRQGKSSQGLEPLSKILVDVFDRLQELSMSGSDVPGMATGFADLDRTLTGFHGSELILLAARPGMGKTSFALNVLLHAGKFSGKSVVFFSLEMSREQLATRLISNEAFLDNKKLMTGKLSPDDWDSVTVASTALAHTKIFIDDNPSLSVADMNAKCRRVEDLGLVVIDYLQLMNSAKRIDNRVQEISEITRSLKIMAKELNIPVVTLAQLARAGEKRQEHRPVLSDLRDSGSIEQDADIVLFLYRDAYYANEKASPEDVDKNKAEVIVAKNRHGDLRSVPLHWQGEFMRFTSQEVVRHES
jgi:replicative DNA helicase